MILKDLFQDYLVNYEASLRNSPTSHIELVELPTNKYSRMLAYSESKKQNNEQVKENSIEDPIEDTIIKWVYSTPSEIITSQTTKKQNNSYTNQNKWVADMTTAYKKAGLNDNAIKNLIAKNALESAWGTSTQGNYNFGNMTAGKSWTGRIVKGDDKNRDGKPIKQKFRDYDSLDDFVKDEIQFLTKLYDFNQDDDLSTFLNKLQGGNKGNRYYAEDPSYKNKVKSLYMRI